MNHKLKHNLKPLSGTSKRRYSNLLSYTFLFVLALLIMIPFFQLVINSLKGPTEIEADVFFPSTWYVSNYVAVFKETAMLRSFINTFMFLIPPVLCGTFMSSVSAYGFARLRFPGKKVIFAAVMATLIIPNIIILVPAYVMFANFYKWLGTPLPVVVPGMFGGTVTMFFIMQFIRTLPVEMEEAAMIDGLSRGGIFANIIFPLIVPAFVAQLVLNFSGTYNDYLTPLLYLGNNPRLYTVQLAINQMNSGYSVETEKLLAASVIALLPTIILFIFAQKSFTEGIALTGIK